MAVATILPQPQPVLRLLANALTQTHTANSLYGSPFARALNRAVAHVESGIAYEPYNAMYYRIQSASRSWLWHYVTLDHCSCEGAMPEISKHPWCWHRALVHLLTAQAALSTLDRCPRPTLAYVPPRQPNDMATILRECDEMFA